MVKKLSLPRLPVAQHQSVSQIDSIVLVAEGMVIMKFKHVNILNAIFCLFSCYYLLNAQYPIASTCAQVKNVYLFLDYILISNEECRAALPVGVEQFLSKIRHMAGN